MRTVRMHRTLSWFVAQRIPRFAGRLNANAVFVGKLRDRQIDPATMTPGFQKRVADELKAPLDVVVAHFLRARRPDRAVFQGGRQTLNRCAADLRRGG